MKDSVVNRFLRYVKVHTTSKEGVDKIPSTERQFDLARLLAKELEELGVHDVTVSEHCVVTGRLPSNLPKDKAKKVPRLAFVAHMDTSPEESGENVKPVIHENYQGGKLVLPGDSSVVISPEESPELLDYVGSDIITSDGTTLLGGDDKAGIAEIMTALEVLVKDPERKHGDIVIVFTPDEEVGHGVDAVNVEELHADIGYTIDGDEMGVVNVETFNAANGEIIVKGYNTHPGYAKDIMVNSIRVVKEILACFPDDQAPETTEGYEGYYHPYRIEGSVNETRIGFIIRDFDFEELEEKIQRLKEGIESVREMYPKATITLNVDYGYRNMKEIIDKHPLSLELAVEAIKQTGIEPKVKPIRGGTDGAELSAKGLPTPNIFSGALNFHSKKEYVPVIAMEKAVDTILGIIDLAVKKAE